MTQLAFVINQKWNFFYGGFQKMLDVDLGTELLEIF